MLLIPYIFMAFMLLALQVMHAFWTYHIIMSFLFVAKVRAKKSYD